MRHLHHLANEAALRSPAAGFNMQLATVREMRLAIAMLKRLGFGDGDQATAVRANARTWHRRAAQGARFAARRLP
jgi:hypothetical protein